MRFFCTLFNENYKYNAQLLYSSLKENHNDFKIFFFCMDEESKSYFENFRTDQIELISLGELEESFPQLLIAKEKRSLVEYFFTCTSAICSYVLKHFKEVHEIVYLDADIYFYGSPEILFDEIQSCSISIIPHRFNYLNYFRNIYGYYNVGWISFKRDEEGQKCLQEWLEQCLEWCYDRLTFERYADQKYLDSWPKKFKNICIINNIGANAAPWNIGNYKITLKKGSIFLNNTPLVFYHYASLKKIKNTFYTTCSSYFHYLTPVVRKNIYLNYLNKLFALGYTPKQSLRLKKLKLYPTVRGIIRYLFNDKINIDKNLNKSKILLLHCEYNIKGGEEVIVQNEYELLKNAGYDVTLFTIKNKKYILFDLINYTLAPFNLIIFIKMIIKIINVKPNIIHVHNWYFAFSPSVFVAAKLFKTPVVHSIHNYRLLCPSGTLFHKNEIYIDSIKRAFPWGSIKNKVYRNSYLQTFWLAVITRFNNLIGTWKSIDLFLVNSEFAKSLLVSSYLKLDPKKIIVKGNFTHYIDFKTISNRNNNYLFSSRISIEKGILILIEAAVRSKFQLDIIGDGPLVNVVKDYSSRYDNIHYLGNKNRETVLEMMRNCKALIFPTLWFEGMPLTIIEAFQTGTPVIASNIGITKEMITDKLNGLLFKSGDSNSLSDATIYWDVLSQTEKERYYTASLNTYNENYTAEENFKALDKIYMSLNPAISN